VERGGEVEREIYCIYSTEGDWMYDQLKINKKKMIRVCKYTDTEFLLVLLIQTESHVHARTQPIHHFFVSFGDLW